MNRKKSIYELNSVDIYQSHFIINHFTLLDSLYPFIFTHSFHLYNSLTHFTHSFIFTHSCSLTHIHTFQLKRVYLRSSSKEPSTSRCEVEPVTSEYSSSGVSFMSSIAYFPSHSHYTATHSSHSQVSDVTSQLQWSNTHSNPLHTVTHYTQWSTTHRGPIHTVVHYTQWSTTHRGPIHTVVHYTQ